MSLINSVTQDQVTYPSEATQLSLVKSIKDPFLFHDLLWRVHSGSYVQYLQKLYIYSNMMTASPSLQHGTDPFKPSLCFVTSAPEYQWDNVFLLGRGLRAKALHRKVVRSTCRGSILVQIPHSPLAPCKAGKQAFPWTGTSHEWHPFVYQLVFFLIFLWCELNPGLTFLPSSLHLSLSLSIFLIRIVVFIFLLRYSWFTILY